MKKHGFSWNRALGITKLKRNIARKTGIPTTRAGRRNKARRLATSGCLVLIIAVIAIIASAISVFAHSGRVDSSGGHWKLDSNGNRIPGSYHYHRGSDRTIEYSTPQQSDTFDNSNNVEPQAGTGTVQGISHAPVKINDPLAICGYWVDISEQPLYFVGGVYYYPLVLVFNELGVDNILWIAETSEVVMTYSNGVTANLQVGSPIVYLDGIEINIHHPPLIINDRMYVPDDLINPLLDVKCFYGTYVYGLTVKYVCIVSNSYSLLST